MDGANRPTATDVAWLDALKQAPYEFDLYAALRRIECIARTLPRLGASLHPKDDPVRLGQEPDLAFAPAALASFATTKADRVPRLGVLCFGLLGPNGPLPLHMTDYVRERQLNNNDPTFVRFLDMFHHRLLSLFYRAWADSQPTVHFDRPDSDRFQIYLGALIGMGMASLRQRDEVSDAAKRYYAGHLVNHRRNAAGLVALLKDYFRLPFKLTQFVGHWLTLPLLGRCYLGHTDEGAQLGIGTVIGRRVWDIQGKFRLEIGPLNYQQYADFLPGGAALKRLATWVKNYMGDELAWDVRLVLSNSDMPQLKLGRGLRLGFTTWLASQTPTHDLDDLSLTPERYASG